MAGTLLDVGMPRLMLFLLALARVSGLFLFAPILGSRTAPVRVRAVLVFFIAVAMLPVLPAAAAVDVAAMAPAAYFGDVLREVAIGLAIGLVAQMIFGGVELAGQLSGVQMGIGLGTLIDPHNQDQITSLAQWGNLLALLLFLAIDGHHLLIRAVAESFTTVPIAGGFPAAGGPAMVLSLAGGMFTLALKIAAPVMVLLLIVNGAMGVLAKLIPQLNVFIVGFPLNVGAGLLVMAAALPFTFHVLEGAFADLTRSLATLVRAF
jgi:flagellar biosynthetic protein FliR